MKSILEGKEILVIDDSSEVRLITKKILESHGSHVTEAETVDQGIEIAQTNIPHMILLDLIMPEKNGFDWLTKKQTIPSLKAIPILVFTGLSDVQSVQKAISLGTNDYLLKPFRAPVLIQKVKKLLTTISPREFYFDPSSRPEIQSACSGKIMKLNETGFIVESNCRLGPDCELEVESPFFNHFEISNILTKTTTDSKLISTDRYTSELNLIGINEQTIKKIRSIIRGWS